MISNFREVNYIDNNFNIVKMIDEEIINELRLIENENYKKYINKHIKILESIKLPFEVNMYILEFVDSKWNKKNEDIKNIISKEIKSEDLLKGFNFHFNELSYPLSFIKSNLSNPKLIESYIMKNYNIKVCYNHICCGGKGMFFLKFDYNLIKHLRYI